MRKRGKAEPPTLEELVAEYEKAAGRAAVDALSTAEWADRWGVSLARARELLRFAVTSGRMVAANALRETPLRPGYRSRVPVFRFVDQGKGAA